MAVDIDLIWVGREGKYFWEYDWTGGIALIPQQIFSSVIPGWCICTRPQMRNCASGNLEIPGSMLRIAPE
jgi:hypothetical protein